MKAIGEIHGSRAAAWIALTIFATSTVLAGTNVWTSIGPYGGSPRALAIDPQNPDTAYAGTGGGMFKTTNGGASWTEASSGLPAGYVTHSLVIDPQNPNTVYAGGDCGNYVFCGVFKSTDGGIRWNPINLGLDGTVIVVYSLAIDPQTPTTLYAGTSACFQTSGSPGFVQGADNLCYRPGIFKTTNGGASWTGASSGLPLTSVQFGSVSALAIDPQTPTTAYAGTFGGVFKTTNGGMSWSATNSALPCCYAATALVVDPKTPSTIYGTALTGTVVKSTDGGASWSAARLPVTAYCCDSLAIDSQNSNVVYAGGDYAVFKSTDGGNTWAGTGLPSARDIGGTTSVSVAIDPKNPGTVYATTDGLGVFKSTDGASSWGAVNSGLAAAAVFSSAIDPQNPGTIYAAINAGLVKTTNGGANWSAANSGLPTGFVPIFLAVDPQTPSTIYAGNLPTSFVPGIPFSPGGFFKSTDGGASWSAAGPAPAVGSYSGPLALDPQNPSTVYAGGLSWTLLKSTNGGTSWTQTAPFRNVVTALAIDPQNSNTLYLAAEWQEFKSTDGGASWSDLGVPVDSIGDCDECLPIGVLTVDPQNSNTLYAAGSVGVLKSTDGGASWNAMNSGLTPWSPGQWDIISALVIDPQNSNTLYVAIAGRVFESTDGAANWSEVNSGLKTLTSVSTLALDPKDPSTLYAGTSRGIFAITFMPAPIGVASQQAITAMKAAAGTDSLNFWQWAWYWQYLPAFSGAPAGFGVVGSVSPKVMEQIVTAGGGDPLRNVSAEQWVSYFRQVVPQ
jgi:photosystem II stability/assembly factor-like uncharacterized protein